MRILPTLAALACLITGCVLWLLGLQSVGVALAVSSAVLILAFSVVQSPKTEESPSSLEAGLDWALVVAGLAAFALTRDSFFLVSAGVIAMTSPAIVKWVKERLKSRNP